MTCDVMMCGVRCPVSVVRCTYHRLPGNGRHETSRAMRCLKHTHTRPAARSCRGIRRACSHVSRLTWSACCVRAGHHADLLRPAREAHHQQPVV
eukprot:551898-Rhodomonas_salina.1